MLARVRVALDRWRARRAGAARGERGFTLAEALTAVGILGIGLGALLTAMTSGYAGLDGARRSSTALFLAEQRLEEIKALALTSGGWANVTSATFPAEAYGTIVGYGSYRRAVAVTDDPGGVPDTKQVEVMVFYRPSTEAGLASETSVALSTLLVPR